MAMGGSKLGIFYHFHLADLKDVVYIVGARKGFQLALLMDTSYACMFAEMINMKGMIDFSLREGRLSSLTSETAVKVVVTYGPDGEECTIDNIKGRERSICTGHLIPMANGGRSVCCGRAFPGFYHPTKGLVASKYDNKITFWGVDRQEENIRKLNIPFFQKEHGSELGIQDWEKVSLNQRALLEGDITARHVVKPAKVMTIL